MIKRLKESLIQRMAELEVTRERENDLDENVLLAIVLFNKETRRYKMVEE